MTESHDLGTRRAALTRLAVATRERLPEEKRDRDAFFHVYLDGLDKFATSTFVEACRRLETKLDWFPKKHELLEECRAIAQRKADARRGQLRLPEGQQPANVNLEDFKRRVKDFASTRGMK